MRLECDIVVMGSGFGGSLMAMIAQRLGRSVVLLEKGRHPRFAIGESSTPLANLLLEELAQRYDLPAIAPLAKWGTWQKHRPEIACGLKRGFTFYHHRLNEPWTMQPDRGNELIVAASPNDTISDTHWYRPDFDHFLVREAQELGVKYFDETQLHDAKDGADGFLLGGTRCGEAIEVRARFVIDASGPRGFLHRALGLGETAFDKLPPTQALYTHFADVARWDSVTPSPDTPPYPVDDAALHHVFDGGWIWVLRFNNGITSAGVAATNEVAQRFQFSDGEDAWRRLLAALPSVARQFADARPLLPFVHAPRLSFRTRAVAGENWVLLPSAAGFVDPLLSNGFPLTLLGIERLAGIIEQNWGAKSFATALGVYSEQTLRELEVTADLVGGLYANMGDFDSFKAVSMLYFAAAMTSETVRRLGRDTAGSSFLLEGDVVFGPALRECLRLSRCGGATHSPVDCLSTIQRAIAPINLAHLGDEKRRSWYPCLAKDLVEAAPKLGVDPAKIQQLLARCGFDSTRADQE